MNKSTARAGSGLGRCSLSSCTTTYIPVAALRPHPAAARSSRFLRKLRENARSWGTLEARPGIEPRYTALQAAVFCSKSITYYAHPPAIRPPQISNMPACRKSCITADMIADTGVATLPLLTCCKIWHRREHRLSSHHCRCLTCCSTAAMTASHACPSRTDHRCPRPMQTATRSCQHADARDQRRF